MFGNISDYVTDEGLEAEGVELSFGDGRFITVRRAGGSNSKFINHMAKQYNDNDIKVSASPMEDEDDAREIMYDAYAKFVVTGWRGWVSDGGSDLPYTVANCIALFNESREIYLHVVTNANKLDNFRSTQVVESGNE